MHNFIKDTLFGSLVILPILIMLALYTWLIDKMQILVIPLKPFLPFAITRSESASAFLVFLLLIGVLFFVGLALRTAMGSFLYASFEKHILLPFAPGYRFLQESVKPFMPNNKNKPFKYAVLAQPYSDHCYVLGFVTDEIEGGFSDSEALINVYIGTSPIPTSGYTLLVKASRVERLEGATVDEVIRTVIACGAGTSGIILKHHKLKSEALAALKVQTE
jgi:uncharacterized membrane protein